MEDRDMVTPTPVPIEPAVWTNPAPPVEPVPDFAAAESAAINLVAAWEWFREARDVIVAAQKARRVLADHETLAATLEGHAADLNARIASADAELTTKAGLLAAQREALLVDAARQREGLDESLREHAAEIARQRAALDAAFVVYAEGEAATRRTDLNAALDALSAKRDKLAVDVGDLEARANAAQAQLDLVRSMIGKG